MPGATAGRISKQLTLATGRLLVASLLVTAGAVTASSGADAELGRYLSSECVTCHGAAKADSTKLSSTMSLRLST